MCSPASFETAYVQRASPTEPIVDTWPSATRNACVPKTSLVEKSMNRSSVSSVATAASSTLYVPIMFTRIVRTGLSRTVSTPAIAAQWTMWVAPRASSCIASGSSTSAWRKVRFGCSASGVPESASRWRLSAATISLSSTSRCASVVPMKPAPPVIRIRLPWSTRQSIGATLRSRCEAPSSSPHWPFSSAARRARAPRRRPRCGDAAQIAYWPRAPARRPTKTWTLRCEPAGGTLSRPRACLPKARRAEEPVRAAKSGSDVHAAATAGRSRPDHRDFSRPAGLGRARPDGRLPDCALPHARLPHPRLSS